MAGHLHSPPANCILTTISSPAPRNSRQPHQPQIPASEWQPAHPPARDTRQPHWPQDPASSTATNSPNCRTHSATSPGSVNCALPIIGSPGFPESVGNLTSLRTLRLTGNQLAYLPAELRNLTKLIDLLLDTNRLTDLPRWLADSVRLRMLDLTDNQLTELPYQFARCPHWRPRHPAFMGIHCANRCPNWWSVVEQELIAYLRSLEDAVVQYEAKLLLVGEGNVGKTSLVSALKARNSSKGGRQHTESRSRRSRSERPDLDLDMTLRAWDFGGAAPRCHQLFTPRALFLVVWHARQGQERDEVEDWLRRIKLRVGDAAVAMVVTIALLGTAGGSRLPAYGGASFPGYLRDLRIDCRTGEGIDALRTAIGEQAFKTAADGPAVEPALDSRPEAVLTLGKTEPQTRYERSLRSASAITSLATR